jgi:arginase family enzyme
MRLISMFQLKKRGARRIAAEVSSDLADKADWPICHLDVDVIDTSQIPAVNYPTLGGLPSMR